MTGTIKIGGQDYDYEVLYNDIPIFMSRWNAIYWLCKREFKKRTGKEYDPTSDSLIIPNQFYFWVCWKCLVKRGWWPFKKPFRSMRQMIKHIRKDEFQKMVTLAGHDILEMRTTEDREAGNEAQQSQNTLTQ